MSEHLMGYIGQLEYRPGILDTKRTAVNLPKNDNPWRSFNEGPPEDRLLEFWLSIHHEMTTPYRILLGWRRGDEYHFIRMLNDTPTAVRATGLESWREYRPVR